MSWKEINKQITGYVNKPINYCQNMDDVYMLIVQQMTDESYRLEHYRHRQS